MTYADAVKSFADVFLNGFVSMEQSDVDETEQTEDLIDYDGMLYDIVPTETDEVTGYIYSIAENASSISVPSFQYFHATYKLRRNAHIIKTA